MVEFDVVWSLGQITGDVDLVKFRGCRNGDLFVAKETEEWRKEKNKKKCLLLWFKKTDISFRICKYNYFKLADFNIVWIFIQKKIKSQSGQTV